MIDIVTNNVRQIGTPADEGRVYISEKAYKRIKTEGFKDKEVFVLMGHTESSGGRYATFVEAAIAVYDMETSLKPSNTRPHSYPVLTSLTSSLKRLRDARFPSKIWFAEERFAFI